MSYMWRRNGSPVRDLICILEVKPKSGSRPKQIASLAEPQLITQAKFAFETLPAVKTVFSICAIGDQWCLYEFSWDKLETLPPYPLREKGARESFTPEVKGDRANMVITPRPILNGNKTDYDREFVRTFTRIVASLKVRSRLSYRVRSSHIVLEMRT